MNILLVDDSPPAREPLELQLQIIGHQTAAANDGLQALEIFHSERFDLIITDIRMPNMDGLELLKQVRRENPEMDVIMITGYGDMDSSLLALRYGACNYLMKPVSMEELSLAVQTVEKRQSLARRLKEQEAKLAQARKMADLGIVAGGVAHEINNPNTFIRGNIQTLQKFWEVMAPYLKQAVEAGVTPPDRLNFIIEELPKTLEAMLTGTERIKKIVENTATFTRLANNDGVISVDLNECVQGALNGLCGTLGMIGMDLRLTPDLPPVRGTRDAVMEIVTELIRNGARAVATRIGPRIAISTAKDPSGEAILTVEDNGAGIREEDRAKVFTPFFTTETRIGTPGLGLSKVYALARSFGGDVYFTSRHGHGSTFNVRLPFSDAGEQNETAYC